MDCGLLGYNAMYLVDFVFFRNVSNHVQIHGVITQRTRVLIFTAVKTDLI
jgi:hypothetical protein